MYIYWDIKIFEMELRFLIGEEDLDGEPIEISDTSNESSQDGDVLLARTSLPNFLRGNDFTKY